MTRSDAGMRTGNSPSRRTVLGAGTMLAAAASTGGAVAQDSAGPDLLGQIKSARRLLFKGGIVLTMDRQTGDFADADILVENGTIREVRPEIDTTDAVVIDAKGRILLPGFVDTHSHSYQGLLRGTLPNGVVLPDYDRDIQKNITQHYTAQDAYNGVLITALGMLDLGTTTMIDISQVAHTREHVDANLQALRDSGMRSLFALARGIGPQAQYPQVMKELLPSYFSSSDQLITPALATSTDAETFKSARELGVRSVLHTRLNSEPLLALSRAGLLREGDVFIHCTHLNEQAWRVIKDTGGRTSHSPSVEMAMGHGYPAIQDAINAGVRPSLSCDHCATVGQDMFGMMRTTFNLQRLAVQQRQRGGDTNAPSLLTCREVLEFATREGARCAGLDHKVGTLTPGKEADLLMLRADDLNIWPLNNAVSTVVNLMNPGHIDAVFVRGKPRKWGGRLVDVDAPKIRSEVARSRDNVLQKADFKIDLMA
ncbi:MAG: hypothetical protein JWL62_2216 [Hyphomicrobiales bacterium]|nr:hypothetical protein [Hyphomicrobiales bacterium]